MSLEFFESVISQASAYTKEIACHVVGDPLMQSNLQAYLDIIHKYKLKALLTTSGYFLKNHSSQTLFHPSVKQINISLNSFNKNDTTLSFEQYIVPILELCTAKLEQNRDMFINLRVWNLDELMSEQNFNKTLFARLSSYFKVELDVENIYRDRPKSIRIASKVLLHFDEYFEWPTLANQNHGDGTCQGLDSHIAILASGVVVPCCLDCDGVMELGNLHSQSMKEILQDKRARDIVNGFKAGIAVEELCQKCSFKSRFKILL